MNTVKIIDVCYLRPSRTIETILVSNKKKEEIFYLYNYEGNSYRLFNDILEIMNFFKDRFEPNIHFEIETELDDYLISLKL